MHGGGWWPMGWMGPWWILIVLVAIGVWYFASSRRDSNGASVESPEEVLKRRYANSEIDRDTYERMLADVRK